MDIGQNARFSKQEIEAIKSSFKDNDLALAVRNVLLQLPAKEFHLSEEAMKVLTKIVLPTLSADVPIGRQSDAQAPLIGLREQLPEMAIQQIKANDIVIQYLSERLNILAGVDALGGVSLTDLAKKGEKTDQERLISMLAYLHLVKYIENCVSQIWLMANATELTEEEQKAKALKDSSK